jgi:hypothetical protein
MKIAFSIYLIFTGIQINAQIKIAGNYHDHFGGSLDIDSAAKFKYSWSFDMVGSWTAGNWSTSNDTIYLHMTPIYDTVTYVTKKNQTIDSLILSRDTKPRRITMEEANYFYAGGQNFEPYPQKLLCRKNRLYVIDNHGKVDKKWKRGFGSAKKFPPYFVKITMPED